MKSAAPASKPIGRRFNNTMIHRTTTKAGVTLSVYSHYDYAKEKEAALDLWEDRLAPIVTGESSTDVVPF